jgi:hypothetical protein
MTSRFNHLRTIFEQPAEHPKSREELEKDRAQIREDMEFGRRSARQQAAAADPDAAYEAHCKAQALKIANAGQARRGLPLLKRLVDDEPEDADITDGDDQDHTPKKGKKKAKPAADDDEPDADNDEPRDEGDEDNDTNNDKKRRGAANCQPGESVSSYWARVDASAAAIVRAAQRRRGEIQ